MRRPALSAQRDASRRPTTTRSSSSTNGGGGGGGGSGSGIAYESGVTLGAWVQPRLVDAATQILSLQPSSPLRVLGTHFSAEAALLAAYPDCAAASAEKELEDEVAAASLRSSPPPPAACGGAVRGSAVRLKGASGRSDPSGLSAGLTQSETVAEELAGLGWARRRLQPYGLLAVARSTCPTLRATNTATASRDDFSQWMECFALLHRQSRLSHAERAAASRGAPLATRYTSPSTDYRATEEIPTPLLLLYVACVVENHTRTTDWGGPSRLLRHRTRLSMKLLALELCAALMAAQDDSESARCSSASSCSASDAPTSTEEIPKCLSSPEDDSTALLPLLCRLSAHHLELFNAWVQHRLREVAIFPAALMTVGEVVMPVRGDGTATGASNAALVTLQRRVVVLLRRILVDKAYVHCGGPVASVSADTFVALMHRLTKYLEAHQHVAASMAVTLSARVGSEGCACAGVEGAAAGWVERVLRGCTTWVLGALQPHREETADTPPSRARDVWAMYATQLAAAFGAPLLTIIDSEKRSGAPLQDWCSISAFVDRVRSSIASGDNSFVECTKDFQSLTPLLKMEARVSEWLCTLLELHVLTLPCGV